MIDSTELVVRVSKQRFQAALAGRVSVLWAALLLGLLIPAPSFGQG
jgi:hypothetical protein